MVSVCLCVCLYRLWMCAHTSYVFAWYPVEHMPDAAVNGCLATTAGTVLCLDVAKSSLLSLCFPDVHSMRHWLQVLIAAVYIRVLVDCWHLWKAHAVLASWVRDVCRPHRCCHLLTHPGAGRSVDGLVHLGHDLCLWHVSQDIMIPTCFRQILVIESTHTCGSHACLPVWFASWGFHTYL